MAGPAGPTGDGTPGAPRPPVLRWHEPPPSARRVLVLGTLAAGLLSLAVVALVVQNYDVGLLAAVLGAAAAVDLRGALRPRAFVLAGDDGLVVRTGRHASALAWDDVAALRVQRRRLRRERVVVEGRDGRLLVLPADAPLAEIEARRPAAG